MADNILDSKCCPDPAKRIGPEAYQSSNKAPVTQGATCENPIFVSECSKEVSVNTTDCDGGIVAITGDSAILREVVQPPGAVFNVKICNDNNPIDAEVVVRCDPLTGDEVMLQWDVTTNPPTLLSAMNLVRGVPYTGALEDLVTCAGDTKAYGSTSELMCYGGATQFLRWFATKDGMPTGVTWDTLLDGTAFVVSDESFVSVGSCAAAAKKPSAYSYTVQDIQNLSNTAPGRSIGVQNPAGIPLTIKLDIGDVVLAEGTGFFATSDLPVAATVLQVIYDPAKQAEADKIIILVQDW